MDPSAKLLATTPKDCKLTVRKMNVDFKSLKNKISPRKENMGKLPRTTEKPDKTPRAELSSQSPTKVEW